MTSKIAQIREACEMVEELKKHQQPFVPIPILDDPELMRLLGLVTVRLKQMEEDDGE